MLAKLDSILDIQEIVHTLCIGIVDSHAATKEMVKSLLVVELDYVPNSEVLSFSCVYTP